MACHDSPGAAIARPQHWLILASVLATLVLGGCTSASRSTSDSFRLLLQRDVQATPAQVAANRFPQVQLSAPDLSAVMVLGAIDGAQQSWFAGSLAVFQLDDTGLLRGTSGLGRSYQTRIVGASPFSRLLSLGAPVTVSREYDWVPAYALGVKVTGTLSRAGSESVEILGRKVTLLRFEETLSGGLTARNVYWADPSTGFILKSRQYLAPHYAVDMVQLKPYRKAQD
ncbi:YjbF family lipoprotein [Stenotrophomonas sp. CFBP 13718]|uniref:YjbF family lipoprotein n=1 Tax=Stenotrophomonas sp. CFBP 13718 TaxID=2775304 RepID=UPI00177F1B0C|nr:YjbF family lipoprotein [Stenotrophomonas sp. CFBP 13718]MBD8694861.1 YjbF family lipoprotein [Stenotrophomonas sp. CFBP 13718]